MVEPEPVSAELLDALTSRFRRRWQLDLDGSQLTMRPRRPRHGRPQRSPWRPVQIVKGMADVLSANGITRTPLLPLAWGRDTDLVISAVQALDPWLKDGVDRVWREGFLPQPVVRFTGERDASGRLVDGFLTAFVNLSCVVRIDGPARHAELLDLWIEALSAVGLHAGRLEIAGDLDVWSRGPVSGLTLHITADGVGFADSVLLWHTTDPTHMATDLGSGLERLRWLLSGRPWAETVFGEPSRRFSTDLLDAIRAGTLLAMAGIRPTASGSGGAMRRVAQRIPVEMAASGLGRLVAAQRRYWADAGMSGPGWPQLADVLEREVLRQASSMSP